MKDPEKLKEIVKEKYSEIVIDQKSCCSPKNKYTEYSVFNEEYKNLEGYVEDADLNLGCGLPTEHANISSGDSVLDLGSGAGNDCFIARSIVGEEGEVTGLDFTDEMINKAIENNNKLGFKNVNFIKGDIEEMPLEDMAYDVVISNCVLNLVPDKEKAFAEIKRVLKPDGHFCVSDIVLNGELPEKIKNASAMYAGCVSGALPKEEYLDIIKKNDFKNIQIKKERIINVPDEMILEYVSEEVLAEYRKAGNGIYSITVVAGK
ncbi:arsenite methyltransferase [Bacteroidota bacterium]